MRVGFVDTKTRAYAFIEGDDEFDPDAMILDKDRAAFPYPHGAMVLYSPKLHHGRWELEECDPDLSQVFGQRHRNPSVWMSGTIHNVFKDYFWIHRDVGDPSVMCLPSVVDGDYKPVPGDKVRFRAGPSEKTYVSHLQAIRVIGPPRPTPTPSIPTPSTYMPAEIYGASLQAIRLMGPRIPTPNPSIPTSDTCMPAEIYGASTTRCAPAVDYTQRPGASSSIPTQFCVDDAGERVVEGILGALQRQTEVAGLNWEEEVLAMRRRRSWLWLDRE